MDLARKEGGRTRSRPPHFLDPVIAEVSLESDGGSVGYTVRLAGVRVEYQRSRHAWRTRSLTNRFVDFASRSRLFAVRPLLSLSPTSRTSRRTTRPALR